MPAVQSEPSARLWEIDFLRALAVLWMLYFHWFYLLNFWGLKSTDLFSGGWDIFGDLIRNTFFIVVGLSLTLSYQRQKAKQKPWSEFALKNFKRGVILLGLGLVITALSYLVSPAEPIRFGVLSFIGAALIIYAPLVTRGYLAFAFAVFIWLLDNLSTWSHPSPGAYILGFYPSYLPSLDYFPLVPWLASVGVGVVAGWIMFSRGQRRYPFFKAPIVLRPVNWVGQQALLIYLAHIPVFMLGLWLYLILVDVGF